MIKSNLPIDATITHFMITTKGYKKLRAQFTSFWQAFRKRLNIINFLGETFLKIGLNDVTDVGYLEERR